MGAKIILDSAVPAPGGRLVFDDPIMSVGSMVLLDPTHEVGAFEGVPANGAVITNIARKQALAIIGSGSLSDMDIVAGVQSLAGTFVIERSTKGAFHGAITQTTQVDSNDRKFLIFNPKAAIQTYLHANMDHDIYSSCWLTVTRLGITGTPQSLFHKAENTSNFLFHFQGGMGNPSAQYYRRLAFDTTAAGILNGDQHWAIGTTARTGSAFPMSGAGVGNGGRGLAFGVGNFDSWGFAQWNKAPSALLKRMYVEDLTVSGRTYEEVLEIDQELHTAAHTEGGRYYNDSWTAPATLLGE